jgi:protein-S-isoprenylcysteine O-methyltransferase Ste14
MTSPSSGSPGPGGRPTPTVRIGKLELTGPWAVVWIVVVLGLVVALIVVSRPSFGMLLSGGLWLGFIVYWGATAGKGASAKTEESRRSRSVHQLLMNGALLLLFVPVPGLRWRELPDNRILVPAGLAVQVASALLHVWARRHLGRNWSSAVMIKTGHQLVCSGPYRRVRHPIYTAILGMALGTAIVSGQLHALLGVVVIALAYGRKLRLEERRLGEEFGAEYAAYKKRSWALVPGLL